MTFIFCYTKWLSFKFYTLLRRRTKDFTHVWSSMYVHIDLFLYNATKHLYVVRLRTFRHRANLSNYFNFCVVLYWCFHYKCCLSSRQLHYNRPSASGSRHHFARSSPAPGSALTTKSSESPVVVPVVSKISLAATVVCLGFAGRAWESGSIDGLGSR
jgi:hypothetical protein